MEYSALSPIYENIQPINQCLKGTEISVIQAHASKMAKTGAVYRLMYAITMLLQPFGPNDITTLFEIIRPVCLIAGWETPNAIRPLRSHSSKERSATDQYAAIVAHSEGIMLKGLYCKMLHDTDYPGDFLCDIGFCLTMRVMPKTLQLDVRAVHKDMEHHFKYSYHKLTTSRRHTLRVLQFICLGIKNNDICYNDVMKFSDSFPPDLITKLNEHQRELQSFFVNKTKRNYVRGRQRSLRLLTDRDLRKAVDWLVSEASIGHLIVAIERMQGYSRLTAALAWDALSTS